VINNEQKLSSFSLREIDAFFSFRKAVIRARVRIIIVVIALNTRQRLLLKSAHNDNDNTEELY